jgi:hypothetical protein
VIWVGLLLALVVWVQRRAVGSFFGADDLIHLEQAMGILPTPLTPWRVLTQVLYFRVMLLLFGPAPAWYMLVTLILHAGNVVLLYLLVHRLTARRSVALLAAGFFGAHPLHLEVLFRAVTISETASSACVLGAALCLSRPRPRKLLGTGLFVLGILSKESILAMPIGLAYTAFLTSGGRRGLVRALPVGVIAVVAAAAFLLSRQAGWAPGGAAYSAHLGANVFHNAMTYLAWAFDLFHPLPDLVRSYDARAWRLGLIAIASLLPFLVWGRLREGARWGVVWWASALLPVLVLQNATYGHYAYLSLAGIATTVATAIATLVSAAVAALPARGARGAAKPESSPVRADHGSVVRVANGVVAVLVLLCFALQADSMEGRRLRLPVPGTDLPLDPFLRSIEVSRRAIVTFGRGLPATATKAVVFVPEGTLTTYGARSGREYPGARAMSRARLFVEAVLDSGRAFRVFYPQVDSVAFLSAWSARYRDWYLFVQVGNGYLENLGVGPGAHVTYSEELLKENLNRSARGYLQELVDAFPDDPGIRFLYSSALARAGEFHSARAQLEHLIARTPRGVLSEQARHILRTTPQLQAE